MAAEQTTAVSRVQAYIDALPRGRRHIGFRAAAGQRCAATSAPLAVADLQACVDLLVDMAPDTERCAYCLTPYVESLGLDQPLIDCRCGAHCADCQLAGCPECGADDDREAAEELAHDRAVDHWDDDPAGCP